MVSASCASMERALSFSSSRFIFLQYVYYLRVWTVCVCVCGLVFSKSLRKHVTHLGPAISVANAKKPTSTTTAAAAAVVAGGTIFQADAF